MKPCLKLVLFALLLSLATSGGAQVRPDKAAATFKVSDGLEITLWASEWTGGGRRKPSTWSNPTCMDVDHKGRVWVCESVNYRCKLRKLPLKRPAGDRILILEDTQGTGVADKVTVFYQSPDTLAPLGIAVAPHVDGPGCTVFVCQSPDILVFEDKDGKGKADGPPRKLLSGFKGYDHDHGVHGIYIGPDNKLYFSVGDQGVKGLVGKNGRQWTSNSTDCRAGTVWRCDLDGKNLELLAHNFRNHYEPCMDSFGTMFVSDNDDDGSDQTRICYVMPGGNYGYHPRGKGQTHWHEEQPGVVPKLLRTYRGSPTGMCFYEGWLLPQKYHNQLLHTDAGPGQVRCYYLQDKGASYAIDREDMAVSTDSWFRPSDVCVAPDGAVFVADWYDAGVGGHNIRDFNAGRVFRIAPKGNKPSVPEVELTTNAGVLTALRSPNLAVRHMAMTRLAQMDKAQALEILTPAVTQKKDPILRARALWQLARIPNLKFVAQAFVDPDPRFRILALRIFSDFVGQSPADYIPDWRAALIDDPSPAVRREALLLLRDEDPVKAKALIYELARKWDGQDRFYLAAIGIAVGQDKERRAVLLGDFDKQFTMWDAKLVGLLWELRPPAMVPLLSHHLTDLKLPAQQRLQIVDVLAGMPDLGVALLLANALAQEKSVQVRDKIILTLKTNLPEKWAKVCQHAAVKKVVAQLLADPQTTVRGLELIGAAEMESLAEDAGKIVVDPTAPLAFRMAAARALGHLKEGGIFPLLDVLDSPREPPVELQVEAALSLGKLAGDRGVFKNLQRIAHDSGTALAVRQAAVAGLSSSKKGSAWLLEAYTKKKLAADLKADLSRLLRSSPFPDIKNQALVVFPPPPPLDPKKLPSIAALLAKKGSVQRGQKLIAASIKSDAQCLKCHTINGVGGQVGPDLSTIGSKASRENLLESILYPSRAIADQYLQYLIETKKGQQINGLIIEETPEFLLVRDANAKDYRIARDDLETKKVIPTSLMPELIQHLSEQDLVDVVDYLYSLKSPVLPPGTDAPAAKTPEVNTFSIVAYDPDRQEWGVGVASKYLAVGNTVPWAKAGTGAVATQASVNISHGPNGLELLAKGMNAEEALKALAETDKGWDFRQVAVIDAKGNVAVHTGKKCIAYAGHKTGKNYSCQGNLLAGEAVITDMAKAFEDTKGPLAWRIMAALEAADKAGGDKRGKQAAAIIVVRAKSGPNGYGDRYIDLRVDDHKEPVTELARILAIRIAKPK
jgi:putative membrane-bound dehydrogenase-like protein